MHLHVCYKRKPHKKNTLLIINDINFIALVDGLKPLTIQFWLIGVSIRLFN